MVFIKQVSLLKSEVKLDSAQRLSLHALQRQLSLLRLEEYLLLITFVVAGVLGRAVMQGLPSVEPITFFALLAGALFGRTKGAAVGASTWYLSNFFIFGGQGPWTLAQVAAGAAAGYLGGFLQKKPTIPKAILAAALATIVFELITNVASGFYFGFGILISFLTAIPFMIAHLASNVVFAVGIPGARKLALEKGRLNEKEVCKEYIQKLKGGSHR